MAGMNQEQRRYAMKRVEEIKRVKLDELTEKHTKMSNGASDKDKIRAVISGEVGIPYRNKVTLDTKIGDAFDFSKLEPEKIFDRDKYKLDAERLRKEAAKVSDEIMLGDSEAAKKMLEKFESSV